MKKMTNHTASMGFTISSKNAPIPQPMYAPRIGINAVIVTMHEMSSA